LAERFNEIRNEPNSSLVCIDEVLFYQSLIVVATSMNLPIFSDEVQKVVWLVEKMSQSNGPVYV